jgi:transcription elongation factor Elf1
MILRFAYCFFLFLSFISITRAEVIKTYLPDRYSWVKDKTNDLCTSYFSEVKNKDYIASKVECILPAKMEVIGTILIDIENYSKWMDECVETKIINTVGENLKSYNLWYHQHVPLLKDRDMILHSETIVLYPQKSIQIFSYSNQDIKYDSNKSLFRMPSFFSWYNLEWIDRSHTKVTFLIDPDLGPGLPIGISNSLIKKVPIKSILALKKMTENKSYQESSQKSYYAKVVEDGIKLGFFK